MHKPLFELFKSTANGQFYFRLKAANGQIILSSEGYTTKQSCEKGIHAVKENAPHDSRYARKDQAGHYHFNLKAANGEVIGSSETYTSAAARENGISSVKTNAPLATVEDRS